MLPVLRAPLQVFLAIRRATASTLIESALIDQGFGVLTEIDVAATLKNKIGKDAPAQIILGACNPHLADRALAVEPWIGLLLPCNVVLRDSDGHTVVSVLDPATIVTCTGNRLLEPVAADARLMLAAVLETISSRAVD